MDFISQKETLEVSEITGSNTFGRSAYGDKAKKTKVSLLMISGRRNMVASMKINESRENNLTRCEMDNHADTCCLGPNLRATFVTDQVCDVSPFLDDYKPMVSVTIVTGCTTWDDPNTGEKFILQFHQSPLLD